MAVATRAAQVAIEGLEVSAYKISTDQPESDGTLEWDATTIVVVEVAAGGERGIGYTYGDAAAATFVESVLAEVVTGANSLTPPRAWLAMRRAARNAGQQGVGAMAISAVDIALWDLKARLAGASLADVLPRFHDRVPIYGSGGFTSYADSRLAEQLAAWAEQGLPRVKMKIGRDPDRDPERLTAARDAVGPEVDLMVDANGAYRRKEALAWAERLRDWNVTYFEEPLSSDDLEGLRLVRDRAPAGIEVAAGEYGWDTTYFQRMLDAGAVDVLQADVTRCGGITALLQVGSLCAARGLPFSAHCAPAISAHACTAMETLAHLEYFHDHVRIEGMLFEGVLSPSRGCLEPDRDRPGLGLELRRADARRFEVG